MLLLEFISKIKLCFQKFMPWYLEHSGVSTYTCRVSTGGVRGEREGGGRGEGGEGFPSNIYTSPSKRLTHLLQRTPPIKVYTTK